jgi:hypothetical protein
MDNQRYSIGCRPPAFKSRRFYVRQSSHNVRLRLSKSLIEEWPGDWAPCGPAAMTHKTETLAAFLNVGLSVGNRALRSLERGMCALPFRPCDKSRSAESFGFVRTDTVLKGSIIAPLGPHRPEAPRGCRAEGNPVAAGPAA